MLLARLAVAELDPLIATLVATEILPHVESVERGQHANLRFEGLRPAVILDLVRRAGISEAPLRGSAAATLAATLRERERATGHAQLRSAGSAIIENAAHADLVLTLIPHLPEAAVGWPMRAVHSYTDIPTPADAGERIARIEEIERVLWHLATGGAPAANEPWRRTFAFFEAGVWFDQMALGRTPPA